MNNKKRSGNVGRKNVLEGQFRIKRRQGIMLQVSGNTGAPTLRLGAGVAPVGDNQRVGGLMVIHTPLVILQLLTP